MLSSYSYSQPGLPLGLWASMIIEATTFLMPVQAEILFFVRYSITKSLSFITFNKIIRFK